MPTACVQYAKPNRTEGLPYPEERLAVKIDAEFEGQGLPIPLRLIWKGGSVFPVERVVDARVSGESGATRYICRVKGAYVSLLLLAQRWFIEGKVIF